MFYQFLTELGVDDSIRMHVAVGTSLALIIPTSLRSCLFVSARFIISLLPWGIANR